MDSLDQIKKFKMIVESTIVESYSDRVANVANAIIEYSSSTPITPDDVSHLIGVYASKFNVADYSVSDTARRDFIKDVLVQLKGKVSWKRKGASNNPKLLAHLRSAIRMVTKSLENITDGIEPIDHIIDRHRKYGFVDGGYSENLTNSDDFHLWMNVAAKAIMAGDEYGNDADLAKYIKPAALKDADSKGYYSDLVSTTMDAFIDDHPDLASSFGMTK